VRGGGVKGLGCGGKQSACRVKGDKGGWGQGKKGWKWEEGWESRATLGAGGCRREGGASGVGDACQHWGAPRMVVGGVESDKIHADGVRGTTDEVVGTSRA
jgi:hypothetical protein